MLENFNSQNARRLERRKILRWLGVSAIGAFILRLLPMRKTISKKLMITNDVKVSISINKSAVKRNKRVSRNV